VLSNIETMDIYKPEITELLRLVQEKYKKALNTTTDFEVFSLHLKDCGIGMISSSTLKRMWGYVNDIHNPRIMTLDLLSKYIGYDDFNSFCTYLKKSIVYNSSFFTAEKIATADLQKGTELLVGWAPNRVLHLIYEGDSTYRVISSEQSKMLPGDRFETSGFLKGQPLSLPYILRGTIRTSPFIAGRNGGLTILKIQSNG
jgi:hypothetical protein